MSAWDAVRHRGGTWEHHTLAGCLSAWGATSESSTTAQCEVAVNQRREGYRVGSAVTGPQRRDSHRPLEEGDGR